VLLRVSERCFACEIEGTLCSFRVRRQAALACSPKWVTSSEDTTCYPSAVESLAIVSADAHLVYRLCLVNPSEMSTATLCHIGALAALHSVPADSERLTGEAVSMLRIVRSILLGMAFMTRKDGDEVGEVIRHETRARREASDQVCLTSRSSFASSVPSLCLESQSYSLHFSSFYLLAPARVLAPV
jgi:hypothetical protein